MGGYFQEEIVEAKDSNELAKIFDKMVMDAAWDHGHMGYTGSFAEKRDIEVIDGVWTEEDAYEHALNNNDKWGPAFAYKLDDGKWYIAGWCSS